VRQAAKRRNRASGGQRAQLGNLFPRAKAPSGLNIEPDSPAELKARALRHLVRREHSRDELARKLAPHAESPEILEGLLLELESKKQLSNQRFAEARTRQLARKYGAARIRHDLDSKGVSKETAERAVAELDDVAKAKEILARKYGAPATSREERAKRARFLQSRGFSYEVIRQTLRCD
jgi:regulatory protein